MSRRLFPVTARAVVLLLAVSGIVACGDDDPGTPADDVGSDAVDAADGGIDATPDADATPDEDTAPDTTPDVVPDVSPDTTPDVTPDVDPGVCPGSDLCFDERTGNPSDRACTDLGYPAGTTCEVLGPDEACCVPPFACATDQDCEDNREIEGFCVDPRYPCVCVDGGQCIIDICSADAECDDGESCRSGLCVDEDGATGYVARILTPDDFVSPGTTVQLDAVAVLAADRNVTNPALDIAWEIESGEGATVSASGLLEADAVEGIVTVRATVVGNDSDPGDTVQFANIGGDATEGVRVIVIDEATRRPIEGATVVREGDETPEVIVTGDDGEVLLVEGTTGGIHVFADGYAYVSLYDIDDATVLVSVPPFQRARINEVRDGFVCPVDDGAILDETECGDAGQPPCLCYELDGVDVVRGVPDFTSVLGEGEVDVSVSGFSLGNSLLDLNFDLIVGPSIDRVFPDDSPIRIDDAAEIPSGVTLYYNNSPFVDSFIATAPAGERTVWSVGGTVQLSTVLLDILPNLDGDLAIGPIIAEVLPLFEEFYSGVTAPVALTDGGTFPVRDPELSLDVPTQRRVSIEAPELPRIGTGWADTGIFLGGALVPGEGLVPLGISGGSDVVGRGEPDGLIDGDASTDEIDPVTMSMAPIHGSINAPATRYAFVSVALMLDDTLPDAPREATSGIISVLDAGQPLPAELTFEQSTFPQLAQGSAWDAPSRTVTLVAPEEGFDMYRLVFRGDDDRLWIVYADGDRGDIVLPAPTEDLVFEDRTARDRINVVGVTLRSESVDYGRLVEANGANLMDLFAYVEGFSILGL